MGAAGRTPPWSRASRARPGGCSKIPGLESHLCAASGDRARVGDRHCHGKQDDGPQSATGFLPPGRRPVPQVPPACQQPAARAGLQSCVTPRERPGTGAGWACTLSPAPHPHAAGAMAFANGVRPVSAFPLGAAPRGAADRGGGLRGRQPPLPSGSGPFLHVSS